MCGITGLIHKKGAAPVSAAILRMTDAIAHRGPDGEGYAVIEGERMIACARSTVSLQGTGVPAYFPKKTIDAAGPAVLAFGHRRLSIIDLNETGRQPMCDTSGGCWITYNGELYNYVELRNELRALGHVFQSESDTEVVLAAYQRWGPDCVHRFNGMWAFAMFDSINHRVFASRDRLGVKPFYYCDTNAAFAFASEQKALVKGLGFHAEAREAALRKYLLHTSLEQEPENFIENITELWPGHNLLYDLRSHTLKTYRYFHLRDCLSTANEGLSDGQLIEKTRAAVEEAVRLRMRSDVEVGTCLSGGIDSSVIAVLMARHTQKPVSCFTAVFPGQHFNEERYADMVARSISSSHHKIAPTFEGFASEIDELVYAQDVPIWDSSTYAQNKVMQLARANGIKVVLDGQGADELFAGYHHHFIAKWHGMLRKGKIAAMVSDMNAAKRTFRHPMAFYFRHGLIGRRDDEFTPFFKKDFVAETRPHRKKYLSDVNEQLIDDIYRTRLKSFLKCEDRCGMWHGVESRTPFSDDIGLFRLMFSFDGERKIKNGISKYLLREAVRPELPPGIHARYDKKGFETPMQDWIQKLRPQMAKSIAEAQFPFLQKNALEKLQRPDPGVARLFFRLFVLSRWQDVFARFNAPAL